MIKNKFDKWRISWVEWGKGSRMKYRYLKTDKKAIELHVRNLKKYGVMNGPMLCFRIKGYRAFVPVGGVDGLLGLTHHKEFLNKPREYWKKLIKDAMMLINSESSVNSKTKRT